jgi:predicted cupin superfamily sugar epimerase
MLIIFNFTRNNCLFRRYKDTQSHFDMEKTADYWIQHLGLIEHVEGGAFAESYRSPLKISSEHLPPGFGGERNISTSIYFLLRYGQFSALHRIASDEIWHFYTGTTLMVYEIQADGNLIVHKLGNNPDAGEQFQCMVKAGSWFGSRTEVEGGYALVGCTVAPGFDFEDFELGTSEKLIQQYPWHKGIIEALTR